MNKPTDIKNTKGGKTSKNLLKMVLLKNTFHCCSSDKVSMKVVKKQSTLSLVNIQKEWLKKIIKEYERSKTEESNKKEIRPFNKPPLAKKISRPVPMFGRRKKIHEDSSLNLSLNKGEWNSAKLKKNRKFRLMPKFYTRNGIIQHDVSNFKIEESRDMKSSKSKGIQTPIIKSKTCPHTQQL